MSSRSQARACAGRWKTDVAAGTGAPRTRKAAGEGGLGQVDGSTGAFRVPPLQLHERLAGEMPLVGVVARLPPRGVFRQHFVHGENGRVQLSPRPVELHRLEPQAAVVGALAERVGGCAAGVNRGSRRAESADSTRSRASPSISAAVVETRIVPSVCSGSLPGAGAGTGTGETPCPGQACPTVITAPPAFAAGRRSSRGRGCRGGRRWRGGRRPGSLPPRAARPASRSPPRAAPRTFQRPRWPPAGGR
jgi:hypothetical protein